MNKRLLIVVAVFVIGFGVGYGVTWLVVSGPGPERPAPGGAVAAASAPAEDAIEAAAGAVEDAKSVADEVTAPVADAGAAASVPDAAVAAAPDAAPPPEAGAATPEPAVEKPWWDACVGTRCRVDFGRVTGGLSIRRGTLEHGEEIAWRERFAGAARVGMLPAGDATVVEVHGVGMTHGLPAAAYVTWRDDKGASVTGVISLQVGEKVVKLEPLSP